MPSQHIKENNQATMSCVCLLAIDNIHVRRLTLASSLFMSISSSQGTRSNFDIPCPPLPFNHRKSGVANVANYYCQFAFCPNTTYSKLKCHFSYQKSISKCRPFSFVCILYFSAHFGFISNGSVHLWCTCSNIRFVDFFGELLTKHTTIKLPSHTHANRVLGFGSTIPPEQPTRHRHR